MQNYRFNLLEERCSWWDGYYLSTQLPLLNLFITKDINFGRLGDKLANFLKY
jgi:hypothetical protein